MALVVGVDDAEMLKRINCGHTVGESYPRIGEL
jgi:hypothetical protein